jgi:acyl-CoA thioesterase YciA
MKNLKIYLTNNKNMELITTHICKTSEIGIHNNMFGGNMLSLIDESSASYAIQICDTPRMVTIKIDELIFKKPVKVGNLLKVYAKVVSFGTTSVQLYIEVRKHNVYTGEQDVVTHTTIKFVRIDEDGNAIPIPDSIKDRYYNRVETHGKGLLSFEDKSKIL